MRHLADDSCVCFVAPPCTPSQSPSPDGKYNFSASFDVLNLCAWTRFGRTMHFDYAKKEDWLKYISMPIRGK